VLEIGFNLEFQSHEILDDERSVKLDRAKPRAQRPESKL